MGNQCVQGELDKDFNPSMFKVKNVDDDGRELGSGTIEVGLADLILYQKGKDPVRWPLRCLRRYGFDAELFSFESGRRCPTGPGIYAFKCKRAEQLFNLVQDNVEKQGQADDTGSQHQAASRSSSLTGANGIIREHSSGSISSTGGARSSSPHYVNGSMVLDNTPPGSATPRTPSSPTSPTSPDMHNYVNSPGSLANEEVMPSNIHINIQKSLSHNEHNKGLDVNYARLDLNEDAKIEESKFINFTQGSMTSSPAGASPTTPNHCYANLDMLGEVPPQCFSRVTSASHNTSPQNGLQTSNITDHTYANLDQVAAGIGNGNGISKIVLQPPPKKKVNYIQLDLENLDTRTEANSPGSSPRTPKTLLPETPNKKAVMYAMIDFDKTDALIKSQNGQVDHDDGSVRKTRHNSHIDHPI
ncbi:fibroblast growth factor receptor substrate 2-like [Saccoglossus kowalevskii]|uniref:Fibroblast growth factor receptor substrate 2-like n=1 Tax=Saccoglossus kowalevskii TaxID=10224 RepID=A0ABM0MVE9_SACKO|nr:PREDICTED: fibroblast growth factor receptor substrate 2-like [Saccoglossus kowalevskii]